MMRSSRYRDRFDHESELTGWQAPDGQRFLISGCESGYALRLEDGWESDDQVEFEADASGEVFCNGEPVGWKIPAAVLRRAD